jgi:hypothetical protein
MSKENIRNPILTAKKIKTLGTQVDPMIRGIYGRAAMQKFAYDDNYGVRTVVTRTVVTCGEDSCYNCPTYLIYNTDNLN